MAKGGKWISWVDGIAKRTADAPRKEHDDNKNKIHFTLDAESLKKGFSTVHEGKQKGSK